MTIPLLENPLIKKFFDDGPCSEQSGLKCWTGGTPQHLGCMAYRILQAMCEPIKLHERFLIRDDQGGEYRECSNREYGTWHPTILRLPDQFQPERECERNCSNTHSLLGRNPCPCNCHPWPNSAGKPHLTAGCYHPNQSTCPNCRQFVPTKDDAVEEKIHHLAAYWSADLSGSKEYYTKELRELVALAKRTP